MFFCFKHRTASTFDFAWGQVRARINQHDEFLVFIGFRLHVRYWSARTFSRRIRIGQTMHVLPVLFLFQIQNCLSIWFCLLGKSWRAPINMTNLHQVSTACSILVSHGSQSANPNRTDKADKACKKTDQRQLKPKRNTKPGQILQSWLALSHTLPNT